MHSLQFSAIKTYRSLSSITCQLWQVLERILHCITNKYQHTETHVVEMRTNLYVNIANAFGGNCLSIWFTGLRFLTFVPQKFIRILTEQICRGQCMCYYNHHNEQKLSASFSKPPNFPINMGSVKISEL